MRDAEITPDDERDPRDRRTDDERTRDRERFAREATRMCGPRLGTPRIWRLAGDRS